MKLILSRIRLSKMTIAAYVAIGMLLSTPLLLVSAADRLSLSEARALLQRLAGADLKKNQVEIKSIKSGITGDNVIVEAQVETAFRFTRQGRDWKVAEIRFGDRYWESVELIEEALLREKARRTANLLEKVAASLHNYQRVQGRYVIAENFDHLLDEILPRYLNPIVRFDLWGTPINYRGTAEHYQLSSAGPDLQFGTADDLIIEDGKLKKNGVHSEH